jgi:hypothetical protein
MEFVAQLKAYKANIQNKKGSKEQEMQNFKQQIRSQLKSQSEDTKEQASSLPNVVKADNALSALPDNFDSSERFEHLEDSAFFTPHELNPSLGYGADEEDFEDDQLDNFLPNTEPSKFKNDEQVSLTSQHPLSLFLTPMSLLGSSSLSRWEAKAWA